MSQCVPNWELEENIDAPRLSTLRANPNPNSLGLHVPIPDSDYEVAERTWQNGQRSMHGLGPAKTPTTTCKYPWEVPRAGGTLESIVNQATRRPPVASKATAADDYGGGADEFFPWFDHHKKIVVGAAASTDALVPCSNWPDNASAGASVSTRVSSCSGAATDNEEVVKCLRVAREVAPGWNGKKNSVSGTGMRESRSRQATVDTYERETETELGTWGFTSTSRDTPENTSSSKECTKTTTTGDGHDSACQSKPQAMKRSGDVEGKKKVTGKSSFVSTKRSRSADTHNQSERKRRDKINQRMMTLQKMVPNSSKTDKGSILDEVIKYLKQLQAQVQMMKMNLSSMMLLPMTLQRQLQMSMMAPMMGMGTGIMDMNAIVHPNAIAVPPPPVFNPAIASFMPFMPWDSATREHLPAASGPTIVADPMSIFLARQSQPMTMDAYSRMAALLQQLHQPPHSGSKD